MAKKKSIPPKFRVWIDVRKRFKLSHAQIQMARELGMSPKTFGSIDHRRREPGKLPLGEFIEQSYLKRFHEPPSEVLTIEQLIERAEKKTAARREAKRLRDKREAEDAKTPAQVADSPPTVPPDTTDDAMDGDK